MKRVTTYCYFIDNASVKSSPRDFIMRRDSIWKVGRHDSTFKKQNVQQLKIMYLLKPLNDSLNYLLNGRFFGQFSPNLSCSEKCNESLVFLKVFGHVF